MSGSPGKGTSSRNRRWRLKPKLIRVLTKSIASCLLSVGLLECTASAQHALTWDEVKAKFEAANPALRADAINVEEMKAEEITAYLRPNPQLALNTDGTQLVRHNGVWQPLAGT